MRLSVAIAASLLLLLASPGLADDKDDVKWTKGLAALDRFGKDRGFARVSKPEEQRDDKKLGAVFPACRLFRVTRVYEPGDPKAHGATSSQHHLVIRPDDARVYELYEDADVLALAQAEKLVLDTQERARAFADFALGAFFAGGSVEKQGERDWLVTSPYSGRRGSRQFVLETDEKRHLTAIRRLPDKDAGAK